MDAGRQTEATGGLQRKPASNIGRATSYNLYDDDVNYQNTYMIVLLSNFAESQLLWSKLLTFDKQLRVTRGNDLSLIADDSIEAVKARWICL